MENFWVSQYLKILDKLFTDYAKEISKQKVGIIASGGIDSSIIAVYVKKYFHDFTLITLHTSKGVDLPFLHLLAKNLNKKPIIIKTNKEEVNKIKKEIEQLLNNAQIEVNKMQIALASAFYFLLREAKKRKITYIFTGQGPDVLLAGYFKYKNLTQQNLKSTIIKDIPLLKIDEKRDGAIAKKWGVKLINPYLEKEFINFALTIPSELLINQKQEKYLSRLLGKEINLPEKIVNRPKKALQYSTGIQKLIK